MPAAFLATALVCGATHASTAGKDSQPISWEAVSERIDADAQQDKPILVAIDNWRQLIKTDTAQFSTYADFLIAHPGWPDEGKLRGLAERSVDTERDSPSKIVEFLTQFPARTAQGKAAHAMALARLGQTEKADAAAREAWSSGVLPSLQEQTFLARFSSSLTAEDHLKHADAALWRRNTDAAERSLAFVPVTRQAVIAARIAFQRKAPDASLKMGSADPVGVMDPGYLADKARWLAETGDSADARRLLANRPLLSVRPADPEEWYEALLARAKDAASDGDWATAYAIASKVDDAYAPGTDIRAQSLGERDDYTSLTWLAGTAALHHMRRPADAEGMFARYAAAGQSASTQAKGLYWAGRAALAAKREAEAKSYFAQAAAYPDQYYGQLAMERIGQKVSAPGQAEPEVTLSEADRANFARQPLVRAARLLGEQGSWGEQSKFLRAIVATANTDRDHLLADDLSRTLGRPDLGVMAGRRATVNGYSGYDRASFPHMSVPESERDNWTMIHAIARQESQFDRAIVSYAGARGLMQLMPATAREQAGKVGLSYNVGSLFEPDYNIKLGSTYFVRLLAYYKGSYPLAVAAYNAGMGNVNKWLKANGDPRTADTDVIQWIEEIPIYQTKDYVQRVLENAVVYDLMNPMKTGTTQQSSAPLSNYLGKRTPG